MQLTALFLLKDDQILLAMKKRGHGIGRWNGVGGKVEAGESIEAAAKRECQEEIGVTPLEIEKVAEIDFNELHQGERKTLHVHIFTSTKWSGEPVETEEMAPQWFNFNDIPYNEMWDDDTYWLPQILAGKKLRAKFTMDENDKVASKTIKTVTTL